jgi:hypothetical protein
MLNNRKGFVFLAAIAAVLVFLSGGVTARATIIEGTVRCVPKASVNSACTAATTYPTIQAAVTAAYPYDIIYVGPGKYNESVTIDETGHPRDKLYLLGAQAGHDARFRRTFPSQESIVDATGTGNSAIIVEASFVTVDGFTAQNATQGNSTGIDLKGSGGGSNFTPANAAKVVNNILTNNSTGVSLNSEGFGANYGVVIEHNLFKNNNAGTPLSSGDGIFTSGTDVAFINENAFIGNKTSAIGINNSGDVVITNNTSEKDATFVIFTGSCCSQFSNNRGEDFGAIGAFPGAADAAVALGPNNGDLTIRGNSLAEGNDPISHGIAFTTIFGTSGYNAWVNLEYNQIARFPGDGIVAEPAMALDCSILGNQVTDNGLDGIFIDGIPANLNNTVFDNSAYGNHRFDCHDDTSGILTAGTANSWVNNTGTLRYPVGICSPGREY